MKYVKLIRLNNWVKNLFIFLPLFFSSELLNQEKLLSTIAVSFGFSLVTSLVYIINDLFDLDFDKNHPDKKTRPIASGSISPKTALLVGGCLFSFGVIIIGLVCIDALLFTLFYFVLNFFYSIKLKQVPILDFVIVSLGFVIRILIGSEVSDVFLSQWIIVMVFLLSLFLAVTKRRDDVYQYEKENKINREVVDKYNIEYMDKIITVVSSILIVSYLLFITSEDVVERYPSNSLMLTFIFVLIGVLRYNQITYVYNKSGSPVKLLFRDTFLQVILVCWGILFFFIIYKTQVING